jgi:hypothetical protein
MFRTVTLISTALAISATVGFSTTASASLSGTERPTTLAASTGITPKTAEAAPVAAPARTPTKIAPTVSTASAAPAATVRKPAPRTVAFLNLSNFNRGYAVIHGVAF